MKHAIKPVERPVALGERVYHTLRSQLRAGTIGPGEMLQEVQLAELLGVSRTPVREAMARLASEGLLATGRRSFMVPSLTRQDVDDIYELRFLIEPAAMRRVAPLAADPQARAEIDAALAAAVTAHRGGDGEAFRESNVRYRRAWLALVPNRRLVHNIELYADHMQQIRAVTLGSARVRAIVLRGLKRITAALATGDPEGAAAAVNDHLMQAHRAFVGATGLDEPATKPAAHAARVRDQGRLPS